MDVKFQLFPDSASTMAPRVDAVFFFILTVAAFFIVVIAVALLFVGFVLPSQAVGAYPT